MEKLTDKPSATNPPPRGLLAPTPDAQSMGRGSSRRGRSAACPAQRRTETPRLLALIIPSPSPVVPPPELLNMAEKTPEVPV